MCKVLMLSNTSKLKNVKKTIDTIFDLITSTDDDGFGYALLGKNGVFGEKTLNKTWKFGSKIPQFAVQTDEKFGTVSNINGPALFHGRTSTNRVNLLNTHPLQKNGWTLIHNGVVNNRGPSYVMQTTNDTEHLLHYMSTTGISDIETHITGYYAFGAIDPDGKLHIVRDNTAQLYVCFSDTIKSYIFGTTVDMIESLCKEMEWARGTIREYAKSTYTVLKKNEVVSVQAIRPRGYGYTESQYSKLSLGQSIDKDDEDSIYDYKKSTNSKNVLVWRNGEIVEESEYDLETSKDYKAFLAELSEMDASYSIQDEHGQEISLREFDKLDQVSQARCSIVRPDGTLLDPFDYYTDKLGR